MLSAWHDEPFCASNLLVKPLHAGRGVVRNDSGPELRPKANNEVHSSRGGPWIPDCGDGGGKLAALLRIQKIELQVGMRGGCKSEDASLRGVHVVIIYLPLLVNPSPDQQTAPA